MSNPYLESFIQEDNLPIYFHYDSVRNGTLPVHPHWHAHLEMLYITHGHTTIQIDNIEITAKRGDFIIIPSNAIHSCVTVDGLSKYHALIVDSNYCQNLGFDLSKSIFKVPLRDAKINNMMEDIIYDYYRDDEYSNAKVMETVIHLLIYIFSTYKEENKVSVSRINFDQVSKAIEYINKNFRETMTIEEISQHVGMSVSHFAYIFKKTTKMTPLYCINLIRCQKAAEMISQGKHSISEIAYMCGFNDKSYFTKIFKKYMKFLPSQYSRK